MQQPEWVGARGEAQFSKLSQARPAWLARLCAPVGELHPTDATTAGPRPSFRVRPTAELETSDLVSPLAALLKSSPASPATDRRLTFTHLFGDSIPNAVSITRCLSRGGAVRLFNCPLVSSAAAPKLTSSQLLSSTRRSEAKIVSFFNSQSIACAHAHAESTAYRHQHDLPQMPSLKPSQWAVISARIRLGT